MNRQTAIRKARAVLAARAKANEKQLLVTVVPIGGEPPEDNNKHQLILCMTTETAQ